MEEFLFVFLLIVYSDFFYGSHPVIDIKHFCILFLKLSIINIYPVHFKFTL